MKLLKTIQKDKPFSIQKQFVYKDFFFVKKNNRNIRINVDNVYCVKANGGSVEISYEGGKAIAFANLTSFKKQINHANLARVHRSYIVNLINISSFDDQFLYLRYRKEEIKIPFGRTYRKDVLRSFKQLKAD